MYILVNISSQNVYILYYLKNTPFFPRLTSWLTCRLRQPMAHPELPHPAAMPMRTKRKRKTSMTMTTSLSLMVMTSLLFFLVSAQISAILKGSTYVLDCSSVFILYLSRLLFSLTLVLLLNICTPFPIFFFLLTLTLLADVLSASTASYGLEGKRTI